MIRQTDMAYVVSVEIDSRLPKRDQMRVSQSFTVELFDGRLVTVTAGFVTDCHSTPPLLHNLLPAYHCRTNLAAIVHDYLYMHWEAFDYHQLRERRDGFPAQSKLLAMAINDPRAYADEAYYRLMEQMAPGEWRNGLYWVAVRLFGWWRWRSFRN
ncbi:DUF1353 domain-containing protein [Fibrella sp. WM1]|uniref:DUF1353 domain-containing protein n=1 Tax=Fibrella musci TaxID=3242485 RepID=UPI003520BFCE